MPLSLRRRGLAAAAAAASTALLLSACGGSDDTATPDAQAPGGGQNPFAAYTQCLAQNGVTLPTMGGPRGGGRPSGGPPPSGLPRPSGAPDPSGRPGGGPSGGGFFEKPDNVDDATWQKAQEACASVRPSFPAGGPGGQGRPGGASQPVSAYANCLRDRGVDVNALNTADTKAVDALEACKVLSPSPTAR